MPTVQELEDLFDSSDNSSGNDDSDDDDYRDDDDQPQGRQRSQRRVNESDEEKEEEKVEPETEHVPDRPDDVEEDGYVPTDGRNYREPRPPFSGMIWNGLINAFVRIAQENRRPTPAPQCRLSYHPRRRPGFVYFCVLGRIHTPGGRPLFSP